MHEFSRTSQIVEVVLSDAAKQNAAKVICWLRTSHSTCTDECDSPSQVSHLRVSEQMWVAGG